MTSRSFSLARALCGILPGIAIAALLSDRAAAREIVGNGFLPATLGIDDPRVNDELSVPTVSSVKTGDDPSFRQLDVSAEFSKRITALMPINRQSGTNVGVIRQLHRCLDDIDPHGIGRPIFGEAIQSARLFPRN